MSITIGRVHQYKEGAINIRIDRKSVLGNPFYMSSESLRDVVCDKYELWFAEKLEDKHSEQYKEVARIFNLLKEGNNINLQCWCSPKRCHGETIKNFLEKYLNRVGERV